MENTTISVICPTYNRGYIIDKAMRSVQAQTYPDWELIIVDDASTDDTAQVVEAFLADRRITYHVLPSRSGANYARNFGMKVAGGESCFCRF